MFYLQIEGAILVGSSPEILCRVQDGVVTNRPLAGTRRRDERRECCHHDDSGEHARAPTPEGAVGSLPSTCVGTPP